MDTFISEIRVDKLNLIRYPLKIQAEARIRNNIIQLKGACTDKVGITKSEQNLVIIINKKKY